MKSLLILVVLLYGLVGCASTYRGYGSWNGGFEETRLQPNVWRVAFHGNIFTSFRKTEEFAMLRCAELCLENGYTHFRILGEKDLTESRTVYKEPLRAQTTGYGGMYSTVVTGGNNVDMDEPGYEIRIYCEKYSSQVSFESPGLFDARFLMNELAKRWGVAELYAEDNYKGEVPNVTSAKPSKPPLTAEQYEAIAKVYDEQGKTDLAAYARFQADKVRKAEAATKVVN